MKKSKQVILTAILLTAISTAEAQTGNLRQNDTSSTPYHTNVRHSRWFSFFHRDRNHNPNTNYAPRSGGFGNTVRYSSAS